MKKIIVHRPQIQRIPPFGTSVQTFFDKLIASLDDLGLDHTEEPTKNKDLRRDESFNHIVYHTRKKADNWLNAKIGYLNRFFYLDGQGYSGWSEIRGLRFDPNEIDDEIADEYFNELQLRFVTPKITKYPVVERDNAQDLPENAIVFFLQVFDDEVLKLSRASASDIIQGALANRGNRPLILKRHPLCQDPASQKLIRDTITQNENCYQAKGNVHEILPKADMVLCINSGVGFEALLHEKQVLTFGRNDYHFATNALERDETVDDVFKKERKPNSLIRKFLYWYLHDQMMDTDQDDFTKAVEIKLLQKGWLK